MKVKIKKLSDMHPIIMQDNIRLLGIFRSQEIYKIHGILIKNESVKYLIDPIFPDKGILSFIESIHFSIIENKIPSNWVFYNKLLYGQNFIKGATYVGIDRIVNEEGFYEAYMEEDVHAVNFVNSNKCTF
jgi:hypothetical protein